MDYQTLWSSVLTIATTIISGLIALGGKYIKQFQDSQRERMETQDKMIRQMREDYKADREDYKNDLCAVSGKVDTTQADLGKFKVSVQRDFVNREEYIRTTQSLDAKMDRVLGEIGKINVNVAKLAATKEVPSK